MSEPDETLIKAVKNRWPDLNFTEASILRPTPDSVYQFYTSFLLDFEDKISYATGFSGDVKLDLNPEELVFYKMQKFNFIFKRAGIKFLLGDIHQPTHIRTKSFFCICNHVLTYIEGIYQEFIKINGDAMKMREDTEKLYNQRNEIGNDIIKLSEKKEQLLEDKKKLQYKIQSAETMLTEYCLKRAERERRIKEREKDLESLKMAVEKTSSQINLLTAKQKQYLEEMITEEEYLNLKKLEEQLQTENESLANDVKNIEDVLSYDNKISDHYRSCEIAIPDSFNADLVNQHITMEIQFNEMKIRKEKLESELCLLKTSLNNERTKLLESEGCYLAANSEHDRIVKNIQQESEELTLALHKQKEQMSNSKLEASSNNSKLKNENNRYENEIRKLNEHFDKEYIEISEAESLRISKVKKQLNELEKLLSSALKID